MTEPAGIIFDFDGVLVESVDIKTEAFRELFRDAGSHVDEIVAFHQAQGGMSRFEKFRTIYRDILRRPLDDETFDGLCSRFAILVREAIMRCPEVPGSAALLRAQAAAGVRMFIASATPELELRDIVEARKLGAFFRGVFGSPRPKAEITRAILAAEGGNPARWWFIGDAVNDLHAAEEAGVTFIARVRAGDPDVFPPHVRRIVDLTELLPAGARGSRRE